MTKDFLEWICYHLDIIVINFVWVLDVRLVYHAVVFLILWRLWYFIIFMCAGSFISGWVSDESSTFKHVSRWFYIMDNCESYVICKTIVELKHWHVPSGIVYNLSLRLLIHDSHINNNTRSQRHCRWLLAISHSDRGRLLSKWWSWMFSYWIRGEINLQAYIK